VLFYLTPVWATLFAYVALSERVGLGRWLAGCWNVYW
jgi:drug/metabolite transporter (DMT)-like permease